jgi:exopolysaccharide biosynthesis polyprenyl glycosylphosphotransferase
LPDDHLAMTVTVLSDNPLLTSTGLASPRSVRPAAVWLTKAYVVAADVTAIALAMVLAFRCRTLLPGSVPTGAESQHVLLGGLSIPVWLALFANYHLYSARYLTTRLEELRRVVHAVAASVLAIAVVGFMLQWYVARGWLVLTLLFGVPVVALERELVRRAFTVMRRQGRMTRPVMVVGANEEGFAIANALERDRDLGYRLLGVIDREMPVDDVVDSVLTAGATSVIVATTGVDCGTSNRLTRRLTDVGVHVELSSSLADIAAGRLTVRPLGRFPIVYVEPVRRAGWRASAKRMFDVMFAVSVLVAASPVLAVAAWLIRRDGGPVLFRQERVGRDGRRFPVLKLRTMVVDAEARLVELAARNEADGPLFKLRDDPRVTPVGRVLRKLSIDELPQLWNVLRGEMSVVGPRPALASEMASWSPELHDRLRVKPGLTGMWQVSGRADATFEEYVRLDLYYVDNWTLWTDLAIVARTVPTVLFSRGAY